MKKRNTRHEKRLKRLIVTCLLCAIILTVSTYAWFIGMQTVNVSTFEVKIASVEDLALSLDGITFTDELTVSEDILNVLKDASKASDGVDYVYKGTYATGNTNSWTSLEPMSSVGKIDTTSNRMVLFEKGSLTATTGGYRIMAEAVDNDATAGKEVAGYVAFDLFIKNMSGEAYYDTIDEVSNEEAIYLAHDSKVTVKNAGTDTTGIENSVRVAFAQIGRVKSNTDGTVVQGITCNDATVGDVKVTGICANRDATIWEPNDKKHVTNAITWFSKTCKVRGEDGKYDDEAAACEPLVNETQRTTYAVSGNIDAASAVDVYDGHNGYTGTIATAAAANKLVGVDTFTDTEKDFKSENRKEFMTLAPNSITKVRVYVYLEGQDVDNYDFASLGSNILVNFGFTKERFDGTEEEGVKPIVTPQTPQE